MAAGKAKTRGPISKALAGKMSLDRAFNELMSDYRNGVSSAANAWVAGEIEYLKKYVPEIKKFVNDPKFKSKSPQERVKEALKKTSEIAQKYDEEQAEKLNNKIIQAYQNPQGGGNPPLKTSSKNTGNTVVV